MITVTRTIQFSAAHFYYLPELSEAENWEIFGPCSNRHGHGHNYTVEVAVQGQADPQTGMVVNLKDLKQILQEEIFDRLDHQNLNLQIPHFADHIPTLENIAVYLWNCLLPHFQSLSLNLVWIRIEENDSLFIEYYGPAHEVTMLYLSRRFDFAAAHRLFNPEFSDEMNWEIFRECNNPNGHGHNYELEVTICGEPDPKTGMLVNLLVLDELIKAKLIQYVDHKHLNFDVAFLEGIIPTAENLAVAFWKQLAPAIPKPYRLYRVRLQESRKNATEYFGPIPADQPLHPQKIEKEKIGKDKLEKEAMAL